MISVVRPPASEELVAALDRPRANGLSETEWANWWYGNTPPTRDIMPPAPAKGPTFRAFKEPAVSSALDAMFGDRCCYCESRYRHVTPTDIEHFRPKGAWRDEKGKLSKTGYYWLAAEWENLLASCPDCNRERAQTRRLSTGKAAKKGKSGKANHFPLGQGSPRATRPGEEAGEQPLLLDPCGPDDPSLHLQFGVYGFIAPAATPAEGALPKGSATIEVCGLDRSFLVEQRAARAKLLIDAMARVCRSDRTVLRYPDDEIARLDRETDEAVLDGLAGPNHEFQALTSTLMTLFTALRTQALAYYRAAQRLKIDKADAEGRAALIEAVARIKGLIARDSLNADLVLQLLPHWGIVLPEELKPAPVG